MEHTRKLTLTLALLAGAVFFRCSRGPTEVGGGAVENGNAFNGQLVSESNGAVPNALVIIGKSGHGAAKSFLSLYSTTTDNHGYYSVANVDTGFYHFQAKGVINGDSVFTDRDSIRMPDLVSAIDLGTDTLKQPAGIFGYARKLGAPDHSGIIVYVPGTSFLSVTDTNGQFLILGLTADTVTGYRLKTLDPEGTYTAPERSGIKVHKHQVDTLADTIFLVSNEIATVTGLAAEFDSLRLVGKVQWNPSADPSIAGYNVYRDWLGHTLFTQTPLNGIPLITTPYWDSTLVPGETYVYRIKAVNQLGAVGSAFSEPDTLTPVAAYLWPDSAPLSLAFDSLRVCTFLQWPSIDTEFISGYRVYRQLNFNALNFDFKTEVMDTFFLDSNLTPGQTYIYRLKAINKMGDLGVTYSERETVTVKSAYLWPDSEALSFSYDSTESRITFTWTKIDTSVISEFLLIANQGSVSLPSPKDTFFTTTVVDTFSEPYVYRVGAVSRYCNACVSFSSPETLDIHQ